MSHDPRDTPNPFAPPRPTRDRESQQSSADRLDDLLPGNEDYAINYPDDDYDPEELLDDDEERDFNADWRDREPLEYPEDEEEFDEPAAAEHPDWIDDDDNDDEDEAPRSQTEYDDEDDDDWDSDEDETSGEGFAAAWPLGLIAVGALALVLLGVGGYGVIQDRAAMEQELRELQSELAVAVSPQTLAAERNSQRDLVERQEELREELSTLRLENQRLADTLRGLEQQLQAQQNATELATQAASEAAAAAAPAATAPKTVASGQWFVNFGSYSQRQMAESWAARIKPASGEVTVSSIAGGSLYRVRIIGLADKASAQRVATALQETYDLSRLWVGQE